MVHSDTLELKQFAINNIRGSHLRGTESWSVDIIFLGPYEMIQLPLMDFLVATLVCLASVKSTPTC